MTFPDTEAIALTRCPQPGTNTRKGIEEVRDHSGAQQVHKAPLDELEENIPHSLGEDVAPRHMALRVASISVKMKKRYSFS